MELAELGYDSKRRYMPQINLLYVYSLGKNSAAPVYYKQFLGSTPDVSAFPNILQECGISSKDYTVIADKGFASEEDFDELTRLGLQYVIPIKRGSRIVAECLPLNPGCYTDVFTYNSRAIQAFKIEKTGSTYLCSLMRNSMQTSLPTRLLARTKTMRCAIRRFRWSKSAAIKAGAV